MPEPKAAPITTLPLNLAAAEDILIQRALHETGGNIAEAARLLGVHRTRIYRKLAEEETKPQDDYRASARAEGS
jgi:DNA-binding NtrC family response regulator